MPGKDKTIRTINRIVKKTRSLVRVGGIIHHSVRMEFEDKEEETHFREVLISFKELPTLFEHEFARKEKGIKLSNERMAQSGGNNNRYVKDFASVVNFESRFKQMRACNTKNSLVLDAIVSEYESNHIRAFYQALGKNRREINTSHRNLVKVKSTLHQFAREWSQEGAQEREKTFLPIINEIQACFGSVVENKKKIKICVPGCGLSRLVVEIAALGYTVQGSEFSYQMLLAGDWILNHVHEAKVDIHPWLDASSNVVSFEDVTRAVTIPDVFAIDLLNKNAPREAGEMSVVAGEFNGIYQQQLNQWDCVACSFFLDTASNVCDYLHTIHCMLRKGGVLVSNGPLLYHFQPEFGRMDFQNEDERFESSVEFTLNDLLSLIQVKFKLLKCERIENCQYVSNLQSMMKTNYTCYLIVAQKL